MSEQPQGPRVTPFTERIVTDRFAGKTCIVTGAASGIGRATALRLAREGARVIAFDLSEDALAALKDENADLDLVTVAGNVDDEDAVTRTMDACEGSLFGLVNNAGVMDGFYPIGEVPDEVWDRVFAINVRGLMRMTRAAVRLMGDGGGSIVNLTSRAGMSGAAAGAAYTASKHAVIGITKSTAFMYAKHHIRCNAVAPGAVMTNIGGEFADKLAAERLQPIMGTNVDFMAAPEALAAAICFLLNDDAANSSGSVLACDGGWSSI